MAVKKDNTYDDRPSADSNRYKLYLGRDGLENLPIANSACWSWVLLRVSGLKLNARRCNLSDSTLLVTGKDNSISKTR